MSVATTSKIPAANSLASSTLARKPITKTIRSTFSKRTAQHHATTSLRACELTVFPKMNFIHRTAIKSQCLYPPMAACRERRTISAPVTVIAISTWLTAKKGESMNSGERIIQDQINVVTLAAALMSGIYAKPNLKIYVACPALQPTLQDYPTFRC